MKFAGSGLGMMLFCCALPVCLAQQPERSGQDAIRVQSSMVLVDVISQNPAIGLPVR